MSAEDRSAALATLEANLAQGTPPSMRDADGAKVLRHTDEAEGMALEYTVRKTGEAIDLSLSRSAGGS